MSSDPDVLALYDARSALLTELQAMEALMRPRYGLVEYQSRSLRWTGNQLLVRVLDKGWEPLDCAPVQALRPAGEHALAFVEELEARLKALTKEAAAALTPAQAARATLSAIAGES